MGSGSWTTASFVNYATTRGYDTDSRGVVTTNYSNQEMFKSKELDSSLNPKNVVRECCDSKEHPNTVPVGVDIFFKMWIGIFIKIQM